jgi:hypothetical protein
VIRSKRHTGVDLLYVVLAFLIGDQVFVDYHVPDTSVQKPSRVHNWVWRTVDKCFRSLAGVRPLNGDERHLFRLAQRRHLGRPFTVDGVVVRRFDPVIEIHMNNEVLEDLLREERSIVGVAVRLIREARHALPALADCVAGEAYQKAKVLYGITFIHRGVERFGFCTYPVPNRASRWFFGWYLRHIFRLANPDAARLLQSHRDLFEPRIVAIPKHRLIRQFRPQASQEPQSVGAVEAP